MEELADDVGGGRYAKKDSAEDFFPPGQQQHRVLLPGTLTSTSVSLYYGDSTVSFLPVVLGVGEKVSIV